MRIVGVQQSSFDASKEMQSVDNMFQYSWCDPYCEEDDNNAQKSLSVQGEPNLLVEEMNGLSVREREMVYEEVHGVANVIEETPEFVAKKLQAMRDEIDKIPKRQRRALDRALFLRPSLRTDEKTFLLFLRATRFDPITAAGLMSRHYEHKLLLFGESMLVRSVTMNDLSDAEQAKLFSAPCILLPSRDQSGRGVYLMIMGDDDVEDWKVAVRFAWYQIMSVLEENETMQQRGVVQVLAFHGEKRSVPKDQVVDFIWSLTNIVRDWPFRSCAFHFCCDNPGVLPVFDFIHVVMGKELRVRQRCHFGSKSEAARSLLTFGIDLSDCLTPGEGMLATEKLLSYMETRRVKEALETQKRNDEAMVSGLIDFPGKFDVLMGRGRPFLGWEGNVRLSKLIHKNADLYMEDKINRVEKTMLAMKIVQIIQLNGGRFIHRTEKGWKVVDDKMAKEKVSQGLRAAVRSRTNGGEDSPPASLGSPVDDEEHGVEGKRTRTQR